MDRDNHQDQARHAESQSGPATETGSFEVDLSNCDREPIHLLGAVQSFGFLVAVSSDWLIQHVSANSAEWLGLPPDDLLGRPLAEVFGSAAVHAIRNRLQYLRGQESVERLFDLKATKHGRPLDLAIHLSGRSIVIEGEAAAGGSEAGGEAAGPASGTTRAMIARLQAAPSLPQLLDDAARLLQALTGYDRVMVYRFAENGSGEVVSEARRGGAESFLGQRFPASDIPQQARELYRRNWIRIIADADSAPVPVEPQRSPGGAPLDLSMSVLRSVSPIHIEYLQNMAVRGSLSVSVIVRGQLWGLIACHHPGPLVVSLQSRTAAELFAQVFSLLIEAREREAEAASDQRAQSLHRRLMSTLASDATTAENLAAYVEEMREALDCHGVGIWSDGAATLTGVTPNADEVGALVRFLNRAAAGELYATHHLSAHCEQGAALLPRVAGLLAVPISRRPRDYLLFFRREVASTVTWAGDPAKAVGYGPVGPNGPRLTPRKSFEAWQQVVHGQSTPWTAAERRFAEQLRVTILEVILRLTEAASRDREKARQKQELLIAELNHRVRNILALMRALVGQSREGVDSVEDFAAVLGDRIQSLARAHDQITRDNWSPAALRGLIEAETSAYLAQKADRVRLDGPELLLHPQAFSTVALVVHELVTNAAKHGALCDSTGEIAVSWRLDADGDLTLDWREIGGPPVQAPSRRGFGSTIIERSVPYDLGGEAELDYALDGLRARFLVPAHHLAPGPAGAAAPSAPAADAATPRRADRDLGQALVVEDNMIVAMEAEDLLTGLGFSRCESVGTVESALRLLDARTPDLAVLDVNLGRETSFKVADRLAELEVPFVFATGYGEHAVMPPEHASRPRLSKPFNSESFARILQAARGAGGAAAAGESEVP